MQSHHRLSELAQVLHCINVLLLFLVKIQSHRKRESLKVVYVDTHGRRLTREVTLQMVQH